MYKGIRLTRRREVAIKVEPYAGDDQQLEDEYRTYRSLAEGVGIPKVLWFGAECEFNVLVMDLLGPSLEALFERCHRRFSLKTVLLLADQLVRAQFRLVNTDGDVSRTDSADTVCPWAKLYSSRHQTR